MNRRFAVFLGAISVFSAASTVGAATIYDAATDYSIGANPNGVWTYGFLDPTNNDTATNLTAMNTSQASWAGNTNVDSWDLNNGTFGAIARNTTNTTQFVATTIELNPDSDDQLVLHPNNAATAAADVRFTAPSTLDVNIAAAFAAADTGGTSTDVHIYVNGTSIYDSTVTGAYPTAAATAFPGALVHLAAGDTIDFSVGDGGNGYANDGTSLFATLTPTPEPASLGLLVLGAVSLLARRRRAV